MDTQAAPPATGPSGSPPATTRAVVATAFGGPDVLRLMEVALPEPGPGQAVVEVRAAGVNPADIKRYGGAWGSDPSALPLRLGFEAAGVVTALGPGGANGPAGPLAVGDEVIAFRISGAYADRVTVDGDALVPRPASLGWAEAAGLLLTGATAAHTVEATAVGPADVVLVHAASGGVGRMVVQLALARGARVIGTAAPRHHDALRGLGAVPVAYGPGLGERVRTAVRDLTAAGAASEGDATGGAGREAVDVAIDAAGTAEALEVSLDLVADPGRIASIANFGPEARAAGIRLLGGGPGADPGDELRRNARLGLVELAGAGALRVEVAAEFPLSRVAEAHRMVLEGHPAGKVVLIAGSAAG